MYRMTKPVITNRTSRPIIKIASGTEK